MPLPNTTDEQARVDYIAGLRQLADILEHNPQVPAPITHGDIDWLLFGGDDGTYEQQRELAATIARAMPGTARKYATDDLFRVNGKLGTLDWEVVVDRPAVCERVVTGTETVTRTVPDPEALAKVPTVEVEETVEHVEWVCGPILASEGVSS